MTKEDQSEVEEMLKDLTFVEWDRFVENNDRILVYGWIAREKDSYKDFILLDCYREEPGAFMDVTYTTSSALHTNKIGEILFGYKDFSHNDCKRVEEFFAGIPNVIHLKK